MNTAVAFGYFDGLHIGHRAVIEKLKNYTFPLLVSFESKDKQVVYSEEEKRFILDELGIKVVYNLDPNVYENMDLEDFVKEILVRKVGATVIVVGQNYDKLEELKTTCIKLDIPLDIVPTVEGVSTQILCDALQNDDFEKAKKLLGSNYLMMGPVVHGKSAGAKHGMPTANLKMADNKMFPHYGVYATEVLVNGKTYKGVTNVGLRPSDDNSPIPTCETFIIDFNEQIYDSVITLKAYKFIRNVIKFDNLDQLKLQIEKDIQVAIQ